MECNSFFVTYLSKIVLLLFSEFDCFKTGAIFKHTAYYTFQIYNFGEKSHNFIGQTNQNLIVLTKTFSFFHQHHSYYSKMPTRINKMATKKQYTYNIANMI